MPKTKSFSKLRDPLLEVPERKARIEAYKEAMLDAVALGELRKSMEVTQQELAQRLSVTQVNVSRIEREKDLYLSTLSQYVEALGGYLELNAVFPEQTVHIEIKEAA